LADTTVGIAERKRHCINLFS